MKKNLFIIILIIPFFVSTISSCGSASENKNGNVKKMDDKGGQIAQIEKNMTKEELMRKAIELSIENVENNGGPFGAVIVKDGKIIATGANRVTANNDPTAHAEVSAIRAACEKLGTFDLSGCEIYSSCEPCPMCLSAIYWAHIDKVYYANNKTDAKNIGFDDSFIYDELALPQAERKLKVDTLMRSEAIKAFELWQDKDDKTEY